MFGRLVDQGQTVCSDWLDEGDRESAIYLSIVSHNTLGFGD